MERSRRIPWKALIFLFIVSTIFRGVFAVKSGQYTVFGDEFLHVKLAQSIADGYGLMIRGTPYNYTTCLYSFVISPVFLLTKNMDAAHTLILWVNAALMSSAIFPVFFLAKRYLKNHRNVWLVVAYSLLICEMNYTMQVMQENLNYPLMMCFFLAFSYVTDNENSKMQYIIGLGTFAFLLSICKYMNLAIILAVPGFYLVQVVSSRHARLSSIKAGLVYSLTFLLLKVVYSNVMSAFLEDAVGGEIASSRVQKIQSLLDYQKTKQLIYPAILYVIYVVIATGIFSLPMVLGHWRSLTKRAKKMMLLTVFHVLIAIAAICALIVPSENLGDIEIRFHSRYFFYAFIPIIILFIHLYEGLQEQRDTKGIFNSISILGCEMVLMSFLPLIPGPGSFIDGPSTLFLWIFVESDVLKNTLSCILIIFIGLGIYFLTNKYIRIVYVITGMILLTSACIGPYYYEFCQYKAPAKKNDALLLNEFFSGFNDGWNTGEKILILPQDFAFECYFREPYRCTVPEYLSTGEIVDFGKLPLLSYNANWTDPTAIAPEYIITAGDYPLQGYDELEIGLEQHHLLQKNGVEIKLDYRESGIYSDRWLGTESAVLQLAGAPECTSAQLVLRVDNWLLDSDAVVNYTDSTGYTGSFIIPNTEEQVDICIPVSKISGETAYTVTLTSEQTVAPDNGDSRQLAFRLWQCQLIEEFIKESDETWQIGEAA